MHLRQIGTAPRLNQRAATRNNAERQALALRVLGFLCTALLSAGSISGNLASMDPTRRLSAPIARRIEPTAACRSREDSRLWPIAASTWSTMPKTTSRFSSSEESLVVALP